VILENCNIRHVETSCVEMHLAYNSCLGKTDNDFLGTSLMYEFVCGYTFSFFSDMDQC